MKSHGTGADWSDDEIELLKKLWKRSDLSCGQIADELNKTFHRRRGGLGWRSKGGCIGKAHRLGLPKKNPKEAVTNARAKAPRHRPAAVKLNGHASIVPPRKPLTQEQIALIQKKLEADRIRLASFGPCHISELTSERCHDVLEPITEFMYCGKATVDGVWCAEHRARYLVKISVVAARRKENQDARAQGGHHRETYKRTG